MTMHRTVLSADAASVSSHKASNSLTDRAFLVLGDAIVNVLTPWSSLTLRSIVLFIFFLLIFVNIFKFFGKLSN